MYEKRSFLGTIKGMFVGVAKPAEYIENGKRSSWGSAVALIVIFSLLVPLLTFFLPMYAVFGTDILRNVMDEKVPYFVLNEDGFFCEDRKVWTDNSTVYVEIDTDNTVIEEDVLDDLMQSTSYRSVMIIYSQEILLYSEGEVQTMEWSQLYQSIRRSSDGQIDEIDKDDILDFIDIYSVKAIRIIYFVLVCFTFIAFWLSCLLWGVIGLLISSSVRAPVSFGEIVKASIYIRIIWWTLRKLLKTYVFANSGMLIWTIGFVVILVYLLLAINQYAKKYPNGMGTGNPSGYAYMNYGGQPMGNAAGQYDQMGMNRNPYMNQENMGMNQSPYMNQGNMGMNQNPYMNQGNMGMNQNPYMNQGNMGMNQNPYMNQENMEMKRNPYSYQNNLNETPGFGQNDAQASDREPESGDQNEGQENQPHSDQQ